MASYLNKDGTPNWGPILLTAGTALLGGLGGVFLGESTIAIVLGVVAGLVGGALFTGGAGDILKWPTGNGNTNHAADKDSVKKDSVAIYVNKETGTITHPTIEPNLARFADYAQATQESTNALKELSRAHNAAQNPSAGGALAGNDAAKYDYKAVRNHYITFVKNVELWNKEAKNWNSKELGPLRTDYEKQQQIAGKQGSEIPSAPIIEMKKIKDIPQDVSLYLADLTKGGFAKENRNKTNIEKISNAADKIDRMVQSTKISEQDWAATFRKSKPKILTGFYDGASPRYTDLGLDHWYTANLDDCSRLCKKRLEAGDYENALIYAKMGEALAIQGDDTTSGVVWRNKAVDYAHNRTDELPATPPGSKPNEDAQRIYEKLQQHIRAKAAEAKIKPLEREMHMEIDRLQMVAPGAFSSFVEQMDSLKEDIKTTGGQIKTQEADASKKEAAEKKGATAKPAEKPVDRKPAAAAAAGPHKSANFDSLNVKKQVAGVSYNDNGANADVSKPSVPLVVATPDKGKKPPAANLS